MVLRKPHGGQISFIYKLNFRAPQVTTDDVESLVAGVSLENSAAVCRPKFQYRRVTTGGERIRSS